MTIGQLQLSFNVTTARGYLTSKPSAKSLNIIPIKLPFVVKRNLARSRQSKYSKTKEFKIQRKLQRRNRKQTQDKRELLGGTCCQSGIGISSTHVSLIQSISEDSECKEQPEVCNWIRNCSKCVSITTEFLPTNEASPAFIMILKQVVYQNIQTFYRLLL